MNIYKLVGGILIIALLGGWWYYQDMRNPDGPPRYIQQPTATTTDTLVQDVSPTEVIAENISVPWELVFLPDGELLVTERVGNVLLLKQDVVIPIDGVRHVGEGGLLGATVDPEFAENGLVYLYQTTETEDGLRNRIDRYTLTGDQLTFQETVVDDLPGARYHDGGRIAFGPDNLLYVTLGDAGREYAAQDTNNLAGSILRYTSEGGVPQDNPFGNAIYSYGHRNPQGLAWDEEGNLWSSEHGRSGIQSGFDEINLITAGANYGWPDSQGDTVAIDTMGPKRHSTASITWAPGDIAYFDGSLYMPGLRGETLYEAVIRGKEIVAWHEHFVGEYGRLRSVVVGPDDMLYVTTSNRDGRGAAESSDDRIIKIDPELLQREN